MTGATPRSGPALSINHSAGRTRRSPRRDSAGEAAEAAEAPGRSDRGAGAELGQGAQVRLEGFGQGTDRSVRRLAAPHARALLLGREILEHRTGAGKLAA